MIDDDFGDWGFEPEVPEPERVPGHPEWVLLPVKRGAKEIKQIWRICRKHNLHIIGGYVRYMISPDEDPAPASDVDLFLDGQDEFSPDWEPDLDRFLAVRDDLLKIYDDETEGPLSIYFFNYVEEGEPRGLSVNLIKPRLDEHMVSTGSLYEIMSFFDFPVVRCGLLSLKQAAADPDFLEDERNKSLRWKHINCPIAAVFRAMKYYKKGYFPRPKEVLKLFQDWEEREPEYKERLTLALQRDDLSEEDLMDLEKLLWVD